MSEAFTRREAMKTALKAGTYSAPVILGGMSVASGVAAATPPPAFSFTVSPMTAPAATPPVYTITATGLTPLTFYRLIFPGPIVLPGRIFTFPPLPFRSDAHGGFVFAFTSFRDENINGTGMFTYALQDTPGHNIATATVTQT